MKKLLITTSIIATLMFAGCSKDDDGGGKSCEQRIEDIQDAAMAYSNDPSQSNCEDYRNAIEGYANSNCANSDDFDAILALLDCTP